MRTDTTPLTSAPVAAPAGGLAAEIRAAIEAVNRRTGYLGPSVHQLERWAAEAERLEARATGNLAREWPGSCGF